MTGEEFMELYQNDKDLRRYIAEQAWRRAKTKEAKEEYVQEAWLAISCAPGGYDGNAYKRLVYKTIYGHYWKNYKEELLLHSVKIQYGRNPHDPTEIWINCKNPKRITD